MSKFFLFLFPILLSAKMINGISVAVDNEPITLFEIYKEVAEKSIAYDEAVENLIEKKIRLIEVKKEGIHIDDFELNKELESIATQNRLSLYQFRILLEDKGIDFNEYKDRLKEKLSLEKLDKKIAYRKLKEIDEEELQSYYNSHLDEFSIAKTFKVVKYEASSKELLESVVSNPMFKPNGVSREHLTLEADKINPRLSIVLNETLEGGFSIILTTEKSYITFFLMKKLDISRLSFNDVKDGIFGKLAREREEKVVKEYFEKLKSRATIDIIRLPN